MKQDVEAATSNGTSVGKPKGDSKFPKLLFYYKGPPKVYRTFPDEPLPYVICVDVKHFEKDEVSVKVAGVDTVKIEAKHEEKPNEQGSIFRHFIRRYKIQDYYDLDKLKATIYSDGVLKIVIPCITYPEPEDEEREILIKYEDMPAKKLKSTSEEVDCLVEVVKGEGKKRNLESEELENEPPRKLQRIVEQIKEELH